ncbi:hypothetical protein [Bartonella rattaustraliani]|uniref:hypothetical protein n=1 Tax=Bartonella rattaustraliani TaxID=481139 RepID=UPI0002FDE98E|nr:hypothetical protein [Bartonella rattaustraliani]
MSNHDISIVIAGIIIIGRIIYGLWKIIEKDYKPGFKDTILFIIILGVFWFCEFSANTLLIVAIIAFFMESLTLTWANYQNKQLSEQLKQVAQLLQLKDRECAIYQNIIAEREQRLVEKTQKISPKWIKQWDEEVKNWERDLLEIKNPEDWLSSESSGQWPLMVRDICRQGSGAWFLYETALKKELTDEHIKKINVFIITFKETYLKAVRLMKKNGITLQKFVDPLTRKKRYKHTMLSLHWCLYMVDNMITAEYEQQQKDKASGHYEELASQEIYFKDIPKYTEHETLEEVLSYLGPYSMPHEARLLCICKERLLLLLYDISSDYKAARETFIYYKQLIDTVKEGYMAFDQDYRYLMVRSDINACRKKDNEKKKGGHIDEETPTFEKAYKLGVIEWMKWSSKKCNNQLIFWEELFEIGNSKEKLKIIFGDEKVNALEEAIQKDREQFANKFQEAILENKNVHYYESRAYLIQYLE